MYNGKHLPNARSGILKRIIECYSYQEPVIAKQIYFIVQAITTIVARFRSGIAEALTEQAPWNMNSYVSIED